MNRSAKSVEMCVLVLVQIAYIPPVSIRNVAVQAHVVFKHQGKKILTEIKLLFRRNQIQDLWLEDIDTCVDRVTEHFSP